MTRENVDARGVVLVTLTVQDSSRLIHRCSVQCAEAVLFRIGYRAAGPLPVVVELVLAVSNQDGWSLARDEEREGHHFTREMVL